MAKLNCRWGWLAVVAGATAFHAIAGAIVTTAGYVVVGDVSESGESILLKADFGTVKYRKAKVRWFSTEAAVATRYQAATAASQAKLPEVARVLLHESVRAEPATRDEAKQALKELGEEPPKAKATAPPGANLVSKTFAGKLVHVNSVSGKVEPVKDDGLAGKKLYAIYYSAEWCPPCRMFTPKLVSFYNEMKPKYGDQFEVIFVSSDNGQEEFEHYMINDKMPWLAVDFEQATSNQPVRSFRGGSNGIPCLVVVDTGGNVLADSFINGDYVGPTAVMEKLRKLLTGDGG